MAWFHWFLVYAALPYVTSTAVYVEGPHVRTRRSYEVNKPWPDQVIPYVFDASVPADMRAKYRGFMKTLELNTCIRFFEQSSLTGNHSQVAPHTFGCVLIRMQSKCVVSGLGYNRNGVKMSPCRNPVIYAHEFGHLLGIAHVQERFERDELIYTMDGNIGQYYRPKMALGSADKQSHWNKCDLSLASVMMYDKYTFTWHGWPMYNYLTPNQPKVSTGNFYNYFREISLANRCCGKSTCVQRGYQNEGYEGKVEGSCQAVCPPGFDPKTNCATLVRARRNFATWPSAVTLLAPSTGCPDRSFREATLRSTGIGSNGRFLFGPQRGHVIETHFCTKRDRHCGGEWEPGNYCFLRADTSCPQGFFESSWYVNERPFNGSLKFVNLPAFPEGSFTRQGSNYSFCCRCDGVDWNHLKLPNSRPFLLYKVAGSPCQKVEGMTVSEESLTFSQSGPATSSFSLSKPDITENRTDHSLTMKYCRHQPIDYNCGGLFELSRRNPEVTFSSPGFPNDYGNNRECNWAFKAPEGSKILLDCGPVGLGCGDKLQIRKRVFGEVAVDVLLREDNDMLPVLSIYNKMMLTLTTGQHSCGLGGFQCRATLHSVDDLPYTGRGEDYCGNTNYAVNENGFHECLPWSKVFENNPEVYVSAKYKETFHQCEFESNYCRNPAGNRLMPFCATSVHERNVTLEYCDVGRFIPAFDVSTRCHEMLSRDPLCHSKETRRVCFKTCSDHHLIYNYPAAEPPVRQVFCGPLPLIKGVQIPRMNRNQHPGDQIRLKCISANVSVKIECLSNGQWSMQQEFCHGTGCPVGFTYLRGNCYLGNITKQTGNAAKAFCARHGSHLAWPESQDDLDAIINFRNKFMRLPNTKLWFGIHTNGTHWFSDYDNSPIQGAYMWGNSRVNGYGTTNINDMALLKGNNSMYGANKLAKERSNGPKRKLICKTKSPGVPCIDRLPNCPYILQINPRFTSLVYSHIFCRYTIGDCQPASCAVPNPASGVAVSENSTTTGSFVSYHCTSGYIPTGEGNSIRACQRDGTLTGYELVCTAVANSPYQLVYYPMEDTTEVSRRNEIMTGPSVYLTAKVDSTVRACRAYCRNSGTLKLQFWGPGSSPKHFVLHSEQTVTCLGRSANVWDFHGNWNVTSGQFLGVYDMTGGLVARHNCYRTKNLNAANYVRFRSVDGEAPSIGETLMFSLYPKCYSVMADCLLVPTTYHGPEVPIKFRT